ncbi:hypothetical protein CBR_g57592 [Chara braunii]|uniref:Uncharacterized protein n=1 Tax=Chara braunii TaxID=69332 RepID=A0A388ME76_CHABU|nr:hypothetical protein CBR_g57592 [Chara braunii]|eukprot:GBG92866.1 hypothetical protein CBR_g57592 [Chara braunii]
MCPYLGALVRPVSGECLAATGSVVLAQLAGPTCLVGFAGADVASGSLVAVASMPAVVSVVAGEQPHAGCIDAAATGVGGGAVAAAVLVVVVGYVVPTAPVAGVVGGLGYSPDATRVAVVVAGLAIAHVAASEFALGHGARVVVVAAASVGCTAVGGCAVAVVGGVATASDGCRVFAAPGFAPALVFGQAFVCDAVVVEPPVVAAPGVNVCLLAPGNGEGVGAFFAPAAVATITGPVVCVGGPAPLVAAAESCVVPRAMRACGGAHFFGNTVSGAAMQGCMGACHPSRF